MAAPATHDGAPAPVAPAPLPPSALLHSILSVATAAAREAGSLIRAHAGSIAVEKAKATSQDLVTEVDRKCQQVVEIAVRASFPTHDVLGEESVPAGAEASAKAIAELASREWLWVVDPIDGTTNFVHGLPFSAVSIGVAHRGAVVVGVVYEPYRDEMFTAVKGEGAALNGTPIHVASEPAMAGAVWGFGTHHTKHVASAMLRGVGAMVDRCRGVRSFGSAAVHLAYVSCGRLTGFWELDLSSWDVAAGSLLVMEAGGRVTDTRGDVYTLLTRDVYATNGQADVHAGGLAVLSSVDAIRPDART